MDEPVAPVGVETQSRYARTEGGPSEGGSFCILYEGTREGIHHL
jgi:hypothetical protein